MQSLFKKHRGPKLIFVYCLKNLAMDKVVQRLIEGELRRQQEGLEMIASENYVSKAVLEAYANVFTNKYSEGYPGKRYYWGQERVDRLELLTQYRALKIFDLDGEEKLGRKSEEVWRKEDRLSLNTEIVNKFEKVGFDFEKAAVDLDFEVKELVQILESIQADWGWGVNVQPLSWSPANLAVYVGLLQPGDTILGMDLSAGGHLTHGFRLSASGIFYNAIFYWVRKQDHLIDRDQILNLALEHKPKLIIAGYSAYPRKLDWAKFAEIADKVHQKWWYRPYLMADIAHIAGLIAWDAMEWPFERFDVVTTTTHKTLRGPRGALIYWRRENLKKIWRSPKKAQEGKKKDKLGEKINRGVFPGVQGWPHEHIIAAKAVAFGEILKDNKVPWRKYAQDVVENAQVLAEELLSKGWKLITWWTDNHLILMDVASSLPGLDGKIAEKILEKIGISVNKNSIPFDEAPPLRPSGLRLWTPALTTRGFGKKEFKQVAKIIDKALKNYQDEKILQQLKEEVGELAREFPLWY